MPILVCQSILCDNFNNEPAFHIEVTILRSTVQLRRDYITWCYHKPTLLIMWVRFPVAALVPLSKTLNR